MFTVLRKLSALGFVGVVASLSGCASIVHGTHETINLSTRPVKGASCHLENSKGKYYLASTPGKVKVHRDGKDLLILCSKASWSSNKDMVSAEASHATMGNLFVGGLIGMAVDASDGANFYYPANITVPLKKVHTATFKPVMEKLIIKPAKEKKKYAKA